jgi:spore maturation protein CgeB
MKIVVFGLAVSSCWGNGHATLWRGLARALDARGVEFVFFERDQPYYARTRDLPEPPGMRLHIYDAWDEVRPLALAQVKGADASLVTSYCADGRLASDLVRGHAQLSCFYDLDTPVTLHALERGQPVPYLPADGLAGFDLVLSYTGGRALQALQDRLGAGRVATLYGSVDPELYAATDWPARSARAALSHLGTYSEDRRAALYELFLRPASLLPEREFLLGGAQYPSDFPWRSNINFARHVPAASHPAFYASAPLTLNVTRSPMAALGYCPSARFFEAAACGVPVLSDVWEGVEAFFEPEREVLLARTTKDVLAAIDRGAEELAQIGQRARERVLAEHTAGHRADELIALLSGGP